MTDVLRGTVTRVIDGDIFEMVITEVTSGDRDQYDDVERIRVATLAEEEEGATPIDDDPLMAEEVGAEDLDGTPEEVAQQSGEADPVEYYGVRSKEGLEERVLERTVQCSVHFRNHTEELVCDVRVM